MINGLGVVGWGVGGIEAEAVMLGQPIYMLTPEVVGFKLIGKLPEGATATDLVLRVTEMLRDHGVVGRFVEYYGAGLSNLTLPDKATLANMSPEYGATIGFFPVDEQTLKYLRLSGRDEKLIGTVEAYYKAQGMWRDDSREIRYSSTIELDMGTIEPALAGPKRPQDRIGLSSMRSQWHTDRVKVFSRETLLDKVWGYDYFGDGRLVDVHVRRLRTKVEADAASPRYVVTARGLGYKLQP